MDLLNREASALISETNKKTKDIIWNDLGRKFIIRNVPYSVLDADGKQFISIGVSLKLELIKQLMLQDEIPYVVDYDEVADLKF